MRSITTTYLDGRTVTVSISDTASAADQTKAIQTQLNAVAKAGGGTVSLSEGTWTVTGTGKAADGALRVGSNTTLEGAGAGATTIKLADGSSAVTGIIRTDSGKTLPDGSIKTTANVTVQNLTIDGNKANTTGDVDGFYCGPKPGTMQADTNITLRGVEIENCSRYGFDPHERTVGLSFVDCTAHDNGVDGFTIDACYDVLIQNCRAYDNGRHGFNLVTGTTGVKVVDSVAEGNGGSGLVAQTGDNELRAWTTDITVEGGRFADNGRGGIELKQVTGVDVAGATVSGNGMDGILIAGATDVSIAAMTFAGNGGTGSVGVSGYLQTFGDADPLNDRWINARDIIIDGTAMANTTTPANTTPWSYVLTDGDDQITTTAGRDVIDAGGGNDRVWAGAGDDIVYGNDGDDILDGGSGNDLLYGGWGDDRLVWGEGFDRLDGGAGNDTADFNKATAAVRVDLTQPIEATMNGVFIADLVSIENVRGGSFTDTLIGNDAANVLEGLGGADVLIGAGGDDRLDGGAGNDRLDGGTGNDVLTGGTGSDVFVFAAGCGADTITDFTRRQDKLELSGVAGFSSLSITQVGGDARIAFGTDSITLQGVSAATLTASDFLFM
jgi:Ca2+-binding RTX toxin-like protein